jgi:lipopolysaccharide biosynthesis protein
MNSAEGPTLLVCDDPVPLDLGFSSSTEHTFGLSPTWEVLESGSFRPADNLLSNRQQDAPSLAVIFHCFWPEALESLLPRLLCLKSLAGVAITTDTEAKAGEIHRLLEGFRGSQTTTRVFVVPNCGRDVLPFWIALRDFAADYDFFLKLHSKKSHHADRNFPQADGRPAGEVWNQDIYHCLLPESDQEICSLLKLMLVAELGAVYPRPWPPLARHGWGDKRNKGNLVAILTSCGISPYLLFGPLIYPVGNMFYGRVAHFLKFADTFINAIDYPIEPIQDDGTVLHAIERCYTFLLTDSGVNTACVFPPSRQQLNNVERPSRKLRIFPLTPESAESRLRRLNSFGDHTSALLIHDLYAQTISNANSRLASCEAVIKSFNSSKLMGSWSKLKRRLKKNHKIDQA